MKKIVPTVFIAVAASLGAFAASQAFTATPSTTGGDIAAPGPVAITLPVPAGGTVPFEVAQAEAPPPDPARLAELMEDGEPAFGRNCSACHGDAGEGGAGPALAANTAVRSRGGVISQILEGAVEHGMPPFNRLDDDEIAAIATFVRNSWGNEYGIVEPEQVAAARNRPAAE